MSPLVSRAPQPALSDHPEFALMLLAALERYHCTLGMVREDYWRCRVWRALAGDPGLEGRVARRDAATVLLTGLGYGSAPARVGERTSLRLHVEQRIEADTGRPPEAHGIRVRWTERPLQVRPVTVRSLLADIVVGDTRWGDLGPYAGDLAPVVIPVVATAEAFAAA